MIQLCVCVCLLFSSHRSEVFKSPRDWEVRMLPILISYFRRMAPRSLRENLHVKRERKNSGFQVF